MNYRLKSWVWNFSTFKQLNNTLRFKHWRNNIDNSFNFQFLLWQITHASSAIAKVCIPIYNLINNFLHLHKECYMLQRQQIIQKPVVYLCNHRFRLILLDAVPHADELCLHYGQIRLTFNQNLNDIKLKRLGLCLHWVINQMQVHFGLKFV